MCSKHWHLGSQKKKIIWKKRLFHFIDLKILNSVNCRQLDILKYVLIIYEENQHKNSSCHESFAIKAIHPIETFCC